MDGAGTAAVRRRRGDTPSRRRGPSLEAHLEHPIYDAVRPWLERLGAPSLGHLNAAAEEAGLHTRSGRRVRFVAPQRDERPYEMRVYETGAVETRPESLHDLFNALAWLSFPRTKAMINALHAGEIPLEQGRRGRKRDLLTLFDEGGAIVRCSDPELLAAAAEHRWKALFWDLRDRLLQGLRISVVGHATLEQALEPWPGITCKALFVPFDADPDCAAAAWLATLAPDATPRLLAPFPVFGIPGWLDRSAEEAFYDDPQYFRPLRPPLAGPPDGKMGPGVGRAAAVRHGITPGLTEESPGSAERDAG